MGAASILVRRAPEVAIVTPAFNKHAFNAYVKYKITKTGYLWAYIRIALVEGVAGKLKEENLGFIGKGLLIESVGEERLVFKLPKKGRKLHREFEKDAGEWKGKP